MALTVANIVAAPTRAAGFLAPLGPVSASERTHLVEVTLLTLIAGLPVLIGVPLIYWRYRRGNAKAAYAPGWGFSRPLEYIMWGVPLAIVLLLGLLLWRDTFRWAPERPLGPAPLEIEAVGLNWKWLFLYPDEHVASLGALVIPAGKPVTLNLTSDTVMQSFMVPSLAGQLYAMPGMVTHLNFVADKTGSALGRNMQYSGNGFAAEQFRVRILNSGQYRNWLASAAHNPVRLDEALYDRLAKPGSLAEARAMIAGKSKREGASPMQLDNPKLFSTVVARYHTGAPIAPDKQPGTSAYRAAEATR